MKNSSYHPHIGDTPSAPVKAECKSGWSASLPARDVRTAVRMVNPRSEAIRNNFQYQILIYPVNILL